MFEKMRSLKKRKENTKLFFLVQYKANQIEKINKLGKQGG